jgi:hypothetical protein
MKRPVRIAQAFLCFETLAASEYLQLFRLFQCRPIREGQPEQHGDIHPWDQHQQAQGGFKSCFFKDLPKGHNEQGNTEKSQDETDNDQMPGLKKISHDCFSYQVRNFAYPSDYDSDRNLNEMNSTGMEWMNPRKLEFNRDLARSIERHKRPVRGAQAFCRSELLG